MTVPKNLESRESFTERYEGLPKTHAVVTENGISRMVGKEKIATGAGMLGYSDDARGVWFMTDRNVANPPRDGEPSVLYNNVYQHANKELWLKPGDALTIVSGSGESYKLVFERFEDDDTVPKEGVA